MQSLSRRFLVSIGIMSLMVTVLGSIGGFVVFQGDLARRQVSYLGDYVRERSTNIDRRFTNLEAMHQSAVRELEARANHITPAAADRLLNVYYPLQADGTRRSRAADFEGQTEANGERIYGMGAFLPHPADLTPRDKAILVAAFTIASDFGQASHSSYDNFYFFTPRARLVMYGPDRPDHLMFYRHDAPANLDISHEDMAKITLPAADPQRLTRCTALQRLIQNIHGERLATGCLTPAYVNGQFVGSFGSSIELTGFFLTAVKNTLPGSTSLIVTADGELIAYPEFAERKSASPELVEHYQRELGLKTMLKQIRSGGRESGVVTSPDGRNIVAYGRLYGPNWYLLLSYPKAAIAWSAAKSASWILLLGLLASMLQTLLVVWMARRALVVPLARLGASCAPTAAGDAAPDDISDIEQRADEIGLLARALRTERERADELLSSLEVRVQERTAELERANAEKSRFLANMSHELRTPLNGVIAVSETLASRQKTKPNRELAELIVSSGRLLEQVLTDILDFSKIEAGQVRLGAETFSLRNLVSQIARLHQAAAEEKGLDFKWSVDPLIADHYRGDPVRLTQILSNLLSNAVKFTETGGVTLVVSAAWETVRFTISDTGIGFDDAVKARLFQRFEQADLSIRRKFGGTGLGLAISRSLVEMMDGRISVTSVPGRGSSFEVCLPLERAETPSTADADDADGELNLEGRRVLLAEDHPTNQKVVQIILAAAGVDLIIVENGQLALDYLKANTVDLVLMDMQMPELDGLSATAEFRAFEAETGAARTPVIMLTANALDEHVKASLAAGADRHLSKPIRPMELLETMAMVIQQSGLGDAAVAAVA
jgi:signal transduction histidine kinase/ActR/RegA family two-component response regulator